MFWTSRYAMAVWEELGRRMQGLDDGGMRNDAVAARDWLLRHYVGSTPCTSDDEASVERIMSVADFVIPRKREG